MRGDIAYVYPNAVVVRFVDPLLPFKYSMLNHVDALYTAISMKRLGGLELEKMMREDHPELMVCFAAENQNACGNIPHNPYMRCIIKPVREEKLVIAKK